jgi:hypothetical protein
MRGTYEVVRQEDRVWCKDGAAVRTSLGRAFWMLRSAVMLMGFSLGALNDKAAVKHVPHQELRFHQYRTMKDLGVNAMPSSCGTLRKPYCCCLTIPGCHL